MPPIARVRRPGGPDSKAQGAWTTAIYEYIGANHDHELNLLAINEIGLLFKRGGNPSIAQGSGSTARDVDVVPTTVQRPKGVFTGQTARLCRPTFTCRTLAEYPNRLRLFEDYLSKNSVTTH